MTNGCDPGEASARIAQLEAELARYRAKDREALRHATERVRRRSGGAYSTSYSVRLDRQELRNLEMRAWELGLPPSVLARNLIRIGVRSRADPNVAAAVARVRSAVEELSNLVPRGPGTQF